jgi:hypothetical protein
MIRNSDISDPDNTEIHRDVWIIVVILYQFRIISVIEGFTISLPSQIQQEINDQRDPFKHDFITASIGMVVVFDYGGRRTDHFAPERKVDAGKVFIF